MSDEQPCCGKCRFSEEFTDPVHRSVVCRRYPPRFSVGAETRVGDWPFPTVHTTDWCGEYQARN
jgi:hypothetical protein